MTPLNNSFTPCTSFCNIYIHRYPPLHSFLFCSRSGGGVGFCHNYGLLFFISHSKQVTEFLSRNNLLDPNQSGFKSGHSTETALALKTARAAAQSSALVLLDLSATFDTVNHRILLSILSSMGISGKARTPGLNHTSLGAHSMCHGKVSCLNLTASPQGYPKAR